MALLSHYHVNVSHNQHCATYFMNEIVQLTPAQDVIALDTHRYRVLCCGRRFGKTTLAIEEIKGMALSKPSSICYVATTFSQARDIAWQSLKLALHPITQNLNESRLEIRVRVPEKKGSGMPKPGETQKGSMIILRGWEAIETLRGQHFDLVVLDEVASMKDFWSNWKEIIRPTLTDTRGEGLFISTPKGFNHFYELFNMHETDTDYASFHYSSYDNPFLPQDEIDKAKIELGPERFAQEYLADFTKTEGLVYKDFRREFHLFTKFEGECVERLCGIDFGFSAPCAAIEIWRDRTDTLWVMSEFYERNRSDAEVAEYVAAKGYNRVYPDPEAPGAIKELRNRRVNVRQVIKGKDSIQNGITKVRDYLRAGKLRIHVSCKNTILEFETYSYPDKKDSRNENENPIDENNHAMDAIRYVIMMLSSDRAKAQQFYPSSPMIKPPYGRGVPPALTGATTRYPQNLTRYSKRRGVV